MDTMATSLAQLGVQYMPSTGGCILDMAAMPASLFDTCSTIHIRVPENQHRIDVHSNMICIKPTQPNPGAYREQYVNPSALSPTDSPYAPPKQQQKRPPSMEGPDSPAQGPLPETKGGDGDDGSSGGPDMPHDHHDDPTSTLQTHARPAYTFTSTAASTFTTHVSQYSQSSALPSSSSLSPTTAEERFSTSATPTLSGTPEEPPVHISAPPIPPIPSATPPSRPAIPEPPTPPARPEIIDAPPPPAYCGNSYFKMDVTTIQTLDPHDLDLYLNLLGIAGLHLDLDHGVGGLVSGLLGGAVDDDDTRVLHRELEHSYRVRCGVAEGSWSSEFKEAKGRMEGSVTARDHTACLEECEKGAIGRAKGGQVRECLGAAWHRTLREGNCRFWMGGKDEFLPVERLRAEEGGEWDLVYL
ncbi:hypothetical protein F4804DRAFT_319335 [Jackrogersella minutella]|nr:hypothetical protein F4804DRAFT_319335 [Jackrogersella minutella]